jgi:hypothetical protein
MATQTSGPLDFGKALRFFFEDPKWVTKIILGGLFAMLSIFVVGGLFVAGYVVGVTRRAARGEARPLPEWDDLGGLFVDGVRATVVYLAHVLPLGVLATLLGLAVGGAASASQDVPDAFRVLAILMVFAGWLLVTVLSLVLLVYIPAAFTRFVLQDRIGAAFDVRENILFIKRNLANYGLALLTFLAASFLSQFGIILFCVGIFPASFWSSCVLGFVLGEVARQDPGSAPETAEASTTTPTKKDSGSAGYTDYLP